MSSKIRDHNLNMKLIDVEYTFDNNKVLFYFTADGRVDFRELVKDLAAVFKTRIELRQIGVRDESKMMGGIGVCGRVLCCKSFLGEFHPVSIKMAKEQGLSLNPTKISGTCGRLMCCLKYEQDAYEEVISRVPKPGAIVDTVDGQGTVMYVNLLREVVKVKLDKVNETELRVYKAEEVKVIKDVANDDDGDIDIDVLKQLED
jgi:cell fate regulator YaaT (PSP1 superfamily)